jgi:hypothetical protein
MSMLQLVKDVREGFDRHPSLRETLDILEGLPEGSVVESWEEPLGEVCNRVVVVGHGGQPIRRITYLTFELSAKNL